MVADRGIVLETGGIVLSGPAEQLLKDTRVQEHYLGTTGWRTNNSAT
jgi:ABC-type branched-subunit amino acid transport system ATPase component